MKQNQLRKILMQHSDVIKRLMPTATQRRVFMAARVYGGVTSAKIAEKFNISLPNATAQLKALYDKGYLTRKDVGDPTGGSLYTYAPVKWS